MLNMKKPSKDKRQPSSPHLYYRLPWKGATIGRCTQLKYTILRSDTEKIVAFCDTKADAEMICKIGEL